MFRVSSPASDAALIYCGLALTASAVGRIRGADDARRSKVLRTSSQSRRSVHRKTDDKRARVRRVGDLQSPAVRRRGEAGAFGRLHYSQSGVDERSRRSLDED